MIENARHRRERLTALGNACVPQQALPLLHAIAQRMRADACT